MSNKTTIVNGAGFVLGIPGTFANETVTDDGAGDVLSTNGIPVSFAGQAGAISLVSPPATTTANVDTSLTFSEQVNHVKVQNTSAFNIYIAYDQTATTGNFCIPPFGVLFDDVPCTVLHILTAGTTAINGNSPSNIFVEGVL